MPDLSQLDSDSLAADIRAVAQRVLEQADGYVARRVTPADFEADIVTLAADLTTLATTAADMADFNA